MRATWDETWMALAEAIARRSSCARRQYGAVLVDADNQVVSVGYNGPPRGWGPSGTCAPVCPRSALERPTLEYDNCVAIHAEASALLLSPRPWPLGHALYVNAEPCWGCCKLIANSGVRRLVCAGEPEAAAHRQPERGRALLEELGVTVVLR